MTEIAEYAMVPAPSLTKLVDRMVADNLVYRRADPGDRRRVLLYVAERGRALHERAAHRLSADQAAFRGALAGGNPDELDALAAALTHLTADQGAPRGR
jgi:DNA-binding MarR family transcriptional regulator